MLPASMAFFWKLKEKEDDKIKSTDFKSAYFKMFRGLVGRILLWTDVRERLLKKRRQALRN